MTTTALPDSAQDSPSVDRCSWMRATPGALLVLAVMAAGIWWYRTRNADAEHRHVTWLWED